MGASAGPSLVGIGRGGDSNLVLEMDAHDAKSYPGEPTSNVFKHQADGDAISWWGDGSNQSIGTKTGVGITDYSLKYNGYPTLLWTPGTSRNCYLNGTADIPNTEVSTEWTFSCYMRYEDGAAITSMSVYLYYSGSDGSAAGTIVDVGNGWYRVSRSRTGSSDYIALAGFTGITAEKRIYLSGWQLEKKTYATPVVTGWKNRDSTEGVSGEVYDGRPSYTSLMLHGNVGTGTSFYDSGPSKHAITTGGAMTHSSTQSKFAGGAIYGTNGGSDFLTVADSTDFDFGTSIDFTIDYWMYHAGTIASWDCMFELGSIYNNGVGNYLNTDGRIRTHVTTAAYDSAGGVITENTWYHIAVVRSGAVWTTYVNGVSVATTTRGSDTIGQYTDAFRIHNAVHTTGYPWAGYLDEFRVTKGTALWTSAFTPPTRRNRSAPVVDLSGTNNGGNFATKDMTDVATYRDGQVIEPVTSAVWDFDGTDDCINGGKGCRVGNTRRKSIEAWVKGVTTGTKTLLFMGDHGNNYKWQWTTIGGGQYMTGGGYGTRYYWSDAPLTAAGWHHWVDVVDEDQGAGDRVKRYVDGVLLTPNALTTDTGDSFYDGTDMYVDIGMAELGSGPYGLFDGEIGAVRLYRTALSHNQVKQNFNAQKSRYGVSI